MFGVTFEELLLASEQDVKAFLEKYNYMLKETPVRSVEDVAKICDIMAWGCKNLGLLEYDGFKVPVDISTSILGEEVILYDMDLDADVEIIDMDEDAIFGRKTGGESCL